MTAPHLSAIHAALDVHAATAAATDEIHAQLAAETTATLAQCNSPADAADPSTPGAPHDVRR